MSRAGPQYPKLPLDDAISLAYRSYFRQFPDVLRVSWLWLLISAILTALSRGMEWAWHAGKLFDSQTARTFEPPRPISLVIATDIISLLLIMAATSIAVAWHRRVVLDEQPGFCVSNIATREFWHYSVIEVALVAMSFVLPYAIVISIVFIAESKLNIHSDSIILVFMAFASLFIAGFAVALRFILLLPARAIGNSGLSFRQTWQRTRGNIWRLIGGLYICTLLPVILLEIVRPLIIQFMWSPKFPLGALDIPRKAGGTAISALILVGCMLIVPLGTGFLSHAYRHFFAGADLPTERGRNPPPI
jgi:hypothetical protein